MVIQLDYKSVRSLMRPGDIIAFSGRGIISSIIRYMTGFHNKNADVSHIGIILKTKRVNTKKKGYIVQVVESTSLDGFTGVVTNRLSRRIKEYCGNVWWLPLRDEVRAKLNEDKFFDFLIEQEGKPYDKWQAIKCGLDFLPFVNNRENMESFFCSELVAESLDRSGCIPHVNASKVNPIDICRWDIYKPEYYQLTGDECKIRGYNTVKIESQDYCVGDENKSDTMVYLTDDLEDC